MQVKSQRESWCGRLLVTTRGLKENYCGAVALSLRVGDKGISSPAILLIPASCMKEGWRHPELINK